MAKVLYQEVEILPLNPVESALLAAAWHRRKRSVWLSWRLDEPSMKVKGQWYDLDRAVEKTGQTMDLLLTEH
jgi:putative transposase